eukprot:TRINITY_DN611_c1_g1_i1.p1 TRINITY_DN611_c1_g1~~TRINITY_DN611_c1_g1_i1.p1  ORF type:complete len:152 (-),score=66.19 TRINITY_DN611_c1_g1_i1:135-590(-)
MEHIKDLLRARCEIERTFSSIFGQPHISEECNSLEKHLSFPNWSPALNVSETEKKIFVRAELPGLTKDQINVNLHNSTLVISGEKTNQKFDENEHFRKSEISLGSFHRYINVPHNIDPSTINAKYSNGILNVEIPKPEKITPTFTKIPIQD